MEILFTSIVGSICGCDDAESLEDWSAKEIKWLQKFLPFAKGTPKQDVYLRVLGALCPDAFRTTFLTWTKHLFACLNLPAQIAIDGQTHRGSRRAKKGPVHMVHAYACDLGLVMAQRSQHNKSRSSLR
jgi:hypothetical protein